MKLWFADGKVRWSAKNWNMHRVKVWVSLEGAGGISDITGKECGESALWPAAQWLLLCHHAQYIPQWLYINPSMSHYAAHTTTPFMSTEAENSSSAIYSIVRLVRECRGRWDSRCMKDVLSTGCKFDCRFLSRPELHTVLCSGNVHQYIFWSYMYDVVHRV